MSRVASDNTERKPMLVANYYLDAFHMPDRLALRDARARSARPSLVVRDGQMFAAGDFIINYAYTVTRSMGVRFVDVTGDENEIHRTSDIVAGALTASKVILPLEVLFPTLRINSAKIKFTNFCVYNRRITVKSQVRFVAEDKVRVHVITYQRQHPVSEAQIDGVVLDEPLKSARVNPKKLREQHLQQVRDYFEACNIDSEAYFQKQGFRDYTYPFAYVASLPSAALVRQLRGQGGMLNVLTLQFNDEEKIPIGPNAMPEVRIEEGRKRSAFRRILTDIIDGVVTYYKGSAIVNPDSGVT